MSSAHASVFVILGITLLISLFALAGLQARIQSFTVLRNILLATEALRTAAYQRARGWCLM